MSKQVLKDLLETFEDDSTIVTDAGSVKSDKNKTKINGKLNIFVLLKNYFIF